MADLLVLPRPAKNVQNGTGFSGKTGTTGPAEKERVVSATQREQLARTPEPPLSNEGGNGGRKGVNSAIRWGEANRGAYTLRKESEEELLREMLIPT